MPRAEFRSFRLFLFLFFCWKKRLASTGAGGSAQAVQSPRKLAGLLGALVPISWRCLTRIALIWMPLTVLYVAL